MIHEEICTYEVCKLAKEKGLPQDVFGTCEMKSSCYLEDGRFYKDGCVYPIENAYTAPTQSLLQRWLREEKGLVVEVGYYSVEQKYYWRVYDTSKCDVFASFIPPAKSMSRYDTWEQALESGLKYALKELK